MVRKIDVGTLWVSLKEAEFSSRSRFCERRRLPIDCRGVPSISTQNIDQNNQQKLFSKIFMFFIQTQKRQKNSFQFCPEIIIFIAFGPRKLFPCAACLLKQWWCVRAHQVFGPRRALAGREVFSRRDFRHKSNKFDSLAYATTFTTKTNPIPTFSLRVTFDIDCIALVALH